MTAQDVRTATAAEAWRDAMSTADYLAALTAATTGYPAPNPDTALSFDECEAAGVDPTGRFVR